MLAAIVAGVVMAALYGWICIYLKQHQIVTGVAINILALGFCSFFQRVIFGVPVTPLIVQPLQPIPIPVLSEIPVIGPILFDQNILTYLLYVLVPVANFVLFKTSLGLSIRSIGENPEAGDVAGVRVDRLRFLTILFAGVMCGIGGAFYSIGYLGMFTITIIGGRGWIAFAICFLGNWKPLGCAGRHADLRPGRGRCHLHAVERHEPVPERAVYCPALYPDDRADRRPPIVQCSGATGRAVQKGGVGRPGRTALPGQLVHRLLEAQPLEPVIELDGVTAQVAAGIGVDLVEADPCDVLYIMSLTGHRLWYIICLSPRLP